MNYSNDLVLKVCHPKNSKPVRAKVYRYPQGTIVIKVQYLKEVEGDKSFKNGKIFISTNKNGYEEAIYKLTKYIETLFLKSLSKEGKNGNINSSNGKSLKSRRTKSDDPKREIPKLKG